jgi:hypothetical protein
MTDDKITAIDEDKKEIRYVDDQGKKFELAKKLTEIERRAATLDKRRVTKDV